jgi:polyhydroxyalkanoate synthesis regulator phasin
MPRGEAESLIAKLRQMSEEGVTSFFNEIVANENLRRRLGRAGQQLLSNKQSFDRNVETLLDFVNLPSKRDVRELKARLDHLNGQLVNLSMKIDRMLDRAEEPGAGSGSRARKRGGRGAAKE